MATKLEKDVESLKQDIERLRSHLGSTLSDLGSLSHEKVLETKEQIKRAMEGFEGTVLAHAGHTSEVLHDRSEQAIEVLREGVTQRPFATVAISFMVGLMTALLLERHRK